jgi:hypothetical protein
MTDEKDYFHPTDRYSDPDFHPMMKVSDDYPDYRHIEENPLPFAMPVPHRIMNVYTEDVPALHHHTIAWQIPGLKVSGSSLRTNRRSAVNGQIEERPFQYRAILKITIFGFAWHIDYDREKGERVSLKIWFGGGG